MPNKMLNPNTTIIVLPESGVVDPYNPTVAELTAGTNVSCALVRGYTLNPSASSTDDSASICDTGAVTNRLLDAYEGELTFFRDADNGLSATSVYNKAWNLYQQPDFRHWVYRRVGKKNTVAFAANDVVEGFLFSNDNIRSTDGGDSGTIQFIVPELPQGTYTGYVKVKS